MNISPDNRPLITAVLIASVLLVSHGAFWLFPQLFEPLRDQTTDRLFALRWQIESLRPAYDDTIVHVAVDDESLQQAAEFYLGRAEHAQLIRNLGRTGVAAQLHDVIFAAPQSEEGDRALIDATARADDVYFGLALGPTAAETTEAIADPGPAASEILERNRWHLDIDAPDFYSATRRFMTFPELASASRGLGFLDIVVDGDGVYRRAPLLIRDGDGFVPSLPLRVICDYLGVGPDRIEVEPGKTVTLRGAVRPGEEQAADIVIPIDRRGRVIVNYLGPWGTMTHYPFWVVHDASDDRFTLEDLGDELEGKIAIVSWVTTGAGDIGTVPAEALYPLSGIHANVMHSILTGDFLRALSAWEMFGFVELPLLALLFLAAIRLNTTRFVFVPPMLVLAFAASAAAAFLYGNLILDITGPIIVLAASTLVVAAYGYHLESKARAVLRHTFNSYFPPTVVDKIMSNSSALMTHAQKRELTILFSDIRSFTSHTSKMEAETVRRLLNEYFEAMIEIVFEYEGTLDKFIGDGLMVFFGDPEPQSDHAERCVRAAIKMQQAVSELRTIWDRRGDMPLEIRIGVNTGEVIVGNMGSARRLSYTVLGEPVNLAQRLESNAPIGGILISARTNELLAGAVPTKRLDPILVKGIDTPIDVYEVPVDSVQS